MKILETLTGVFSKKTKVESTILPEVEVVIKEYVPPTEDRKFMDIDPVKRNEAGKQFYQNLPPLETARAKTVPMNSTSGPNVDFFRKDPLIVKINTLPAIQDSNLRFIGNSRIDGYPVYEYLGHNPSELSRYPFEEVMSSQSNLYKNL